MDICRPSFCGHLLVNVKVSSPCSTVTKLYRCVVKIKAQGQVMFKFKDMYGVM